MKEKKKKKKKATEISFGKRISKKEYESAWAVGYQKKPGPSAGRENERNRLDMREHLNLFEKETRK